MKKIFFILMTFFVFAGVAGADEGLVRLSRMKAGENPLPILVNWKPENLMAGGTLPVLVGSGWSVNQNVANISVSTSDLPSGVQPLPGVSVGGVGGQNIWLNRDSVDGGVSYGFWISAGIGTNPVVGEGASYKWRVGNTEIKVPVVGGDRVVLTGKVGAKPTDFQLGIGRSGPEILNQTGQVEYVVDYGTYLLSQVTNLKISVSWATDTTGVVDYVVGSGTTGYGGAVPVVDIQNKKIEWTITTLPANSLNNQVKFSLKANSSYQGSQKITFPVEANLTLANVVSIGESISQSYVYLTKEGPTSTPVAGVESSPTPTTAINELTVNKISNVELVKLSDSLAEIDVKTNFLADSVSIYYGGTILKLDSKLISLNRENAHKFVLENLKSGKIYYFRVVAKVASSSVVSDVFTFKTASSAEIAVVEPDSILITSQNNVVMDSRDKENWTSQLIPGTDYSFKFKLSKPESIKKVGLYIKNDRVLGWTSWILGAEPGREVANLVNLGGGNYVGHIISPTEVGVYRVMVKVWVVNGSLTENLLEKIRVVAPLTVKDAYGSPIEGVEVAMYKYNSTNGLFEELNRDNFGFANPLVTDRWGEIRVSIPKGRYQIELSAMGFRDKVVNFVVGEGDGEVPPLVRLEKGETQWFKYGGFYYKQLKGVAGSFFDVYNDFVNSRIGFKLYSIIVLFIGIWLWIKFFLKTFQVFGWKIFSKKTSGKIGGVVGDFTSGVPISWAKVFLIDPVRNKILDKATANFLGEFRLKTFKNNSFKIMATALGYHPSAMLEYTNQGFAAGSLSLWLKKKENWWLNLPKGLGRLFWYGVLLPICCFLVIIGWFYLVNFGVMKVGWVWLQAWLNIYLFFVLKKI